MWRCKLFIINTLKTCFRSALLYAALAHCTSLAGPVPNDNDWYWPRPPISPSADNPIRLPITTERPATAVPPNAQKAAVSRLANAEILPLTQDDCRNLSVRYDPNELLDELIKADADFKDLIDQWKSLKMRQLRPYLVRAVAAEGKDSAFSASLWHNALTITHHCRIETTGADPYHRYASIIFDPKGIPLIKSPAVVYLEAKPVAVYTEIQVVKSGQ
jgi:hypothetical protein